MKKIIAIAAITLLWLTGCNQSSAPVSQKAVSPAVLVSQVELAPVAFQQRFIARTEPVDQANLKARVEGYLIARHFKEGESVNKGQLLFEIDPKPLSAVLKQTQAQLKQAQAGLRKSTRDLKRSKPLYRKGVVSQAEYDKIISEKEQAQALVESASAQVETAEINLQYTKISAPFDGMIGKANFSIGALVSPSSDGLATITRLDPMYVTFQLEEKQLVNFMQQSSQASTKEKGDINLSLELANGSIYAEQGKFSFPDTALNQSTGTLTMRASFPNPKMVLIPGYFVTLRAESIDTTQQPLIPQSAVQQDQQGYYVMLADQNNRIIRKSVKLGRRINAMWAVTAGLTGGEKLVVEGLQKIRSGIEVIAKAATVDNKTGAILPANQ
ncbi:efflux RND transporter periplasmic adaptor subunit [Pelagibaculum spongiae]|uniref:Efflux transporter periplasmic adaptor subunit n=1 Tax=Pelagibaculum spongiae TaxID=2080658 RepID=A0A2V1GRI8_9GAMM|nr:efflux RND transporter periplasmic adaptor subunit [Pelagibaculum spongiae]PVZ65391.1 efflux transporter periplasmic adaptor subunit [Pelagibaculum spongiae]